MQCLFDKFLAATALPWQVVLARLVGAVVLYRLIRFERGPAGLRTHMIVGLASALYCLFMLETLSSSAAYYDRVSMDPLRLVNAITGGVAFLTAGMIAFSQVQVRGLMTGTSLWLAAAIGLGTGFGMWRMAAFTAVLALAIIRLVKLAEDGVKNDT